MTNILETLNSLLEVENLTERYDPRVIRQYISDMEQIQNSSFNQRPQQIPLE
jgi:hypothetical protein